MHATSDTDEKAHVGDAFPRLELTASSGQPVVIPDPAGDFVHLQFRRFAGCPICNLHLRSIVRRYDEIRSHGIREVVVFHPRLRNSPSTRPSCRSRSSPTRNGICTSDSASRADRVRC